MLLVTALLTPPGLVMAENREGTFTFSPFAGGQGFPFGGETHYDADFNWGARGGYNFTENFRLEVVFGVNETVHDPEVAYCTIYQYGADLFYAFTPKKKLVPFVAAGFGAFDVKFDKSETLSDETLAYFNYGGGLEYALTDWLALRADFRDAIMLNSGDHALQGTLGFTFRF